MADDELKQKKRELRRKADRAEQHVENQLANLNKIKEDVENKTRRPYQQEEAQEDYDEAVQELEEVRAELAELED